MDYPYDELLNGGTWMMRRGRDFSEDPAKVIQRLRSAASARGCTLSAEVTPDGRFIDVRATAKVQSDSEPQGGGAGGGAEV